MAHGVCVCMRMFWWGGLCAVESSEQKVQWSERLREEAQANVQEGGVEGAQSSWANASRLIALSDSASAADGFFSTVGFTAHRLGPLV